MRLASLTGGAAGLAVAIALVTTATSAHAQGVAAGGELTLANLGVTAKVPAGAGEWIVRRDDGGDVVQRTRPVNPYLSVLVSAPASGDCASLMAAFAKKGLRKLDKPALVPAGWGTQLLSATSGGEQLVALCTEDRGHALVALVTYGASLDGNDVTSVVPVLEAVGGAWTAKLAAPTPAPEPTAPPAPAPAASQRLDLPVSRLGLVVAGGGTWVAGKKAGRDLVTRDTPASPALTVALELVRTGDRAGGCRALLDQELATIGKGTLEPQPGYLPAGFHTAAVERYEQGVGIALACAEIPAGFLLAEVRYDGSLASEDAGAARFVLAAAHGAAATLARPARPRAHIFGGRSFLSPEFYLAGQHLAPADAADPMGLVDTGLAAVAGVRQVAILKPRSFPLGVTARYQFSIGWDATHGMLLDGMVAIGIGVQVAGITLAPLVGSGADAIGAGSDPADDRLTVELALYNWYGGAMNVELTRELGFEVTGALLDRDDEDGDDRRELRVDGRVLWIPTSFRKVSLGVAYASLEDLATMWQVGLGVGF